MWNGVLKISTALKTIGNSYKSTSSKPLKWFRDYKIARHIAPHFDRKFYLTQTDDKLAQTRPEIHYIRSGAALGLDPAPDFSTTFYLQENPDVSRSGVNPFWHFIRFGRSEGRDHFPQDTVSKREVADNHIDYCLRIISDSFDTDYYRNSYAELPESDDQLPLHYLKVGWILGYDPCDWFSTRDYILANLDVAEAQVNPFVHYLLAGKLENRSLSLYPRTIQESQENLELRVSAIRPHFDLNFYLKSNPDVNEAGIDPVLHYITEGHKENRDPHPDFSTLYYLEANPDVKDAGVNPYLHYLTTGKSEGRHPKHPGGRKIDVLSEFATLDEMTKSWVKDSKPDQLLNQGELLDILQPELAGGRLILSVSHDNYIESAGGIQFCISQEVSLAQEMGDSYLAIFPYQPTPRLAHVDPSDDVNIVLILNGKNIGVTGMNTLCDVVEYLKSLDTKFETIIHQLLGHSVEHIIDLVIATGHKSCSLWLHDFITICPSYTLRRNNLDYCGAPNIDSNVCSICIYGQERRNHQRRIQNLFNSLDVKVFAPSAVAKNIWLKKSGLKPASIKVKPHIKLQWRKRPERISELEFAGIKVAFLGTQAEHKGWSTFTTVIQNGRNRDISYFYFGNGQRKLQNLKAVSVHVTSDNPNAMTEAIYEKNIDFVIHWASWPETFSLTTFEAIAAGAYVITNECSGNVAATISKTGRGAILKDQDDLMSFLSGNDGRMGILLQNRRRSHANRSARTISSRLTFQKQE